MGNSFSTTPATGQTLNGASSFEQVMAAYMDNASYAQNNNPTQARAFITACRILLVMIPARSQKGDSAVEMNLTVIQNQVDEALQWLALNGNPSPAVTFANFNYSRY